MGFNIRGHQRGRQSVKKPFSIQLFIVTPSMAGVNGKVHVFTVVLGNIGNICLGDCPDDLEYNSRSRSRVCLGEVPGDVQWRRRDRRSGTSGDAEQGYWRDRGKRELWGFPWKWTFLVTTCVDTCLKVGGECKGRFAD